MYGDYKSLTPQQITFINDATDFDDLFDQEEEEEHDDIEPETDVEVEDVDEEEANPQPQHLARELQGLEPYNAPGCVGLAGDIAEF